MSAQSRIFVACFAMGIVLTACTIGDPYGLTMHRTPVGQVAGRITGNRHMVVQEALNAVVVDSGASVGIRVERQTDGVFDTEIELDTTSDVTLYLRSTQHARAHGSQRYVALRLTPGTARVTMDDGRTRDVRANVQPKQPVVVRVVNDGPTIDVTVGCTHVGRFTTTLPSTEWVVIQPMARGPVRVTDPQFFSLYESD